MSYTIPAPKISDVTKALNDAGFTKMDAEIMIFGNEQYNNCYCKHRGALYISGENIGFCINSKADARIFGAYETSAINAAGESSEVFTDVPQFFFPRLFGYLAGQISEAEIIAEICN